jgi:ABC-2 type transport system permease protein
MLLLRRVGALALRHIYLHLGSWPRIVEMMYWPTINLASWGFMSVYLTRRFTHVDAIASSLVAGVVLFEIFIRLSMTGLTLFLEEIWSRNLGHLFASPIRVLEYALGLLFIDLMRTAIALTPMLLLADYYFGFSFVTLGWAALPLVILMALNGCIYALMIIALLLRYGLGAEWLGWMSTWLLIPFFAPYFPVSVLPHGFQMVAFAMPPAYVFESLRSLINGDGPQPENLLIALGLTVVYALIAALIFRAAYRSAKKRGGLLQNGE